MRVYSDIHLAKLNYNSLNPHRELICFWPPTNSGNQRGTWDWRRTWLPQTWGRGCGTLHARLATLPRREKEESYSRKTPWFEPGINTFMTQQASVTWLFISWWVLLFGIGFLFSYSPPRIWGNADRLLLQWTHSTIWSRKGKAGKICSWKSRRSCSP